MASALHRLIYSPLQGARDIRLLTIDSRGSGDDISCTLTTASLDHKPSYFALSYVWGDARKTTAVACNGLTLNATQNLIAAMKRLRTTFPLQRFWIDAICINQVDLSERASQVRIMCDIYRSAEKVIVYLGEKSDGLDRAMTLFHTLHEKSKEPITNMNTASMIRESLPPSSEEVWYRLHDFFNRPWFSRIWVIQEVAVAASDPVVLCGNLELSWETIARVVNFLRETALTAAVQARSNCGNVIMIQQFKEMPQSLGFLMTLSIHFEATDPRDMIFALFGILHPEDRSVLELPYFEISYEKSVRDVYRDVTIGCIKHYAFIDVMFRGHSSSYQGMIEGLPSWVPDFSIPPEHQTTPISTMSFLSGYKASGGRKAWTAHSDNSATLRIGGKTQDEVIWVAEPFQNGDINLLPHLRKRPQTLEKLWNEVATQLGLSSKVTDAFWRTLVVNVDRHRAPIGPMAYKYFVRYWHQSKKHDRLAMMYQAAHPDAPASKNEIEQRALFESATAEENGVITEDEFDAFKKYCIATATLNLPCRSTGPQDVDATKLNLRQIFATNPPNWDLAAPKCIHCYQLHLPDMYSEHGIWKVSGTSPALAYRATDPFIADYYHHLENGSFNILMTDEKMHIHAHLMNVFPNRAFFITRDGCMGIGPGSTQVGDKVVILSGASVPAILRRMEDDRYGLDMTDEENPVIRGIGLWSLVGEAYVHGIMGGEAVEGFRWEESYEVFDLV